MSFTQSTFATVGAQAAPSPTVYSYLTADSMSAVTTLGYFVDKVQQLDNGDLIISSTSTGAAILAYKNGTAIRISQPVSETIVNVTTPEDLSGTLSSEKVYFIDGVIDFTGTGINIEVPTDGLSISGGGSRTSRLICSDPSYKLFTSPGGGSGGLICCDVLMQVTGSGAQVFDITNNTGTSTVSFENVAWFSCVSLGVIDGYSQGVELSTARVFGTPELELEGTWAGGYFINSSVARDLTDGAYTLFKAGAGFTMASRFRSNAGIDLPANVSITDFSGSNFPNPSTLQFVDTIVTRDGVSDATDANLTPNITASDLASAWHDNLGLGNTFVGGATKITAEAVSTITVPGTFVDLAGTYSAFDLQHFDSPAPGQLRHLGDSPREYAIISDLVLDSSANDEVDVKLVIFRDATTSFEDGPIQRRVVNNLQGGGRDVAYFSLSGNITLDNNDYAKLQVANVADTNDITAEIDSQFSLSAR